MRGQLVLRTTGCLMAVVVSALSNTEFLLRQVRFEKFKTGIPKLLRMGDKREGSSMKSAQGVQSSGADVFRSYEDLLIAYGLG